MPDPSRDLSPSVSETTKLEGIKAETIAQSRAIRDPRLFRSYGKPSAGHGILPQPPLAVSIGWAWEIGIRKASWVFRGAVSGLCSQSIAQC